MKYFVLAWFLWSVSITVKGPEAFGFGGGRAQETVQEVTQFVNDVRDFYHSATNYYYGNTHIHLSPSLSNPSVTLTYTFRCAPVRVNLVHKETKKVLGVRMVPAQSASFTSSAAVINDKRVHEKLKVQFKSEVIPLELKVNAEIKKLALELQGLVSQKKLSSAQATAQLVERGNAIIKAASGKYPNVSIQ